MRPQAGLIGAACFLTALQSGPAGTACGHLRSHAPLSLPSGRSPTPAGSCACRLRVCAGLGLRGGGWHGEMYTKDDPSQESPLTPSPLTPARAGPKMVVRQTSSDSLGLCDSTPYSQRIGSSESVEGKPVEEDAMAKLSPRAAKLLLQRKRERVAKDGIGQPYEKHVKRKSTTAHTVSLSPPARLRSNEAVDPVSASGLADGPGQGTEGLAASEVVIDTSAKDEESGGSDKVEGCARGRASAHDTTENEGRGCKKEMVVQWRRGGEHVEPIGAARGQRAMEPISTNKTALETLLAMNVSMNSIAFAVSKVEESVAMASFRGTGMCTCEVCVSVCVLQKQSRARMIDLAHT